MYQEPSADVGQRTRVELVETPAVPQTHEEHSLSTSISRFNDEILLNLGRRQSQSG